MLQQTGATPEASAAPADQTLAYVPPCDLPTPWATFQLHAFVEKSTGKEHLALTLGDIASGEPVLARLHSECMTGDALFSQRCDCGAQLEAAMRKVSAEGRGVILYLRQEGRGIGLVNKIHAYRLQDGGADTVEANQELGFAPDQRNYRFVEPMLEKLGVKSLRLMTNNPRKIDAIELMGIEIVERIPIVIERNKHNTRYLKTKAAKLGHLMQP